LESYVKPIVGYSHEVAARIPDGLSMLFIDGAHDYESAKRDFDVYISKLRPGGIIAMHDAASWPGVRRVVRERIYFRLRGVGLTGTIIYAVNAAANPIAAVRALLVEARIAARQWSWRLGSRLPATKNTRQRLRRVFRRLTGEPDAL
jgi:hypothetical protein